MPDIPETGTKKNRLAIARDRVEFWSEWAKKAVTRTAERYFRDRAHHWKSEIKAIEMEP